MIESMSLVFICTGPTDSAVYTMFSSVPIFETGNLGAFLVNLFDSLLVGIGCSLLWSNNVPALVMAVSIRADPVGTGVALVSLTRSPAKSISLDPTAGVVKACNLMILFPIFEVALALSFSNSLVLFASNVMLVSFGTVVAILEATVVAWFSMLVDRLEPWLVIETSFIVFVSTGLSDATRVSSVLIFETGTMGISLVGILDVSGAYLACDSIPRSGFGGSQ